MSSLLGTGIAVAALVALAFAIVFWLRLEKPWLQPWAIARAALQLGVLSLVLRGVITNSWLVAAFLVVMVLAAVWTAHTRLEGEFGGLGALAIVIAAGAVVSVTIVFASGALPLESRYLLAIGGILVGNSMTVTTLVGRSMRTQLIDGKDEYEAWLALGATPRRAALDRVRAAGSQALMPATDQTRTTGLVTLPGAFVGSIFGGASPLEAAQFQLIVLAGILACGAISVLLMSAFFGAPKHIVQATAQARPQAQPLRLPHAAA